jgi:hypothetical protein
MKKVKRYNEGGDSNAGMKEARDEIDAEIARTPSADYGDYTPESSSQTIAAPKAKAPIVTKEQLAKSGLSLRDYMNKQQGLKPRGDAALTTSKAEPKAEPKAPAKSVGEREAERMQKLRSDFGVKNKSPSSMSMKDSTTREAIDAIKASGRKYPDMSALQAPAKRAGMTAMEPRMAKGGTASSRADGIATKGKTRGKMC